MANLSYDNVRCLCLAPNVRPDRHNYSPQHITDTVLTNTHYTLAQEPQTPDTQTPSPRYLCQEEPRPSQPAHTLLPVWSLGGQESPPYH